MNKKEYQKPIIQTVEIQHQQMLCSSNESSGYDGKSMSINNDTEIDENDVW